MSLNIEQTMKNLKLETVCIFDELEVGVVIDDHGEAWFNAFDVAATLDYEDPIDAMSKVLKSKFKDIDTSIYEGYYDIDPETMFIDEITLYKFILRSPKPKAEPFFDFICGVIKDIRKTGKYDIEEEDGGVE